MELVCIGLEGEAMIADRRLLIAFHFIWLLPCHIWSHGDFFLILNWSLGQKIDQFLSIDLQNNERSEDVFSPIQVQQSMAGLLRFIHKVLYEFVSS